MFIILIAFVPFFYGTKLIQKLKIGVHSLVIVLFFCVILFSVKGIDKSFNIVVKRIIESSLLQNIVQLAPEKGTLDYGRSVMYVTGVNAIKNNPITGIGFMGLSKKIEESYGFQMVSHNIIITAWGEMGILGLFSFLWITILAVYRLHKLRRHFLKVNRYEYYFYSATIVSLFVAILHAQFRPQLSNPIFSIILGIAIPASSMKKIKIVINRNFNN
jgi:O-antigen ligase